MIFAVVFRTKRIQKNEENGDTMNTMAKFNLFMVRK